MKKNLPPQPKKVNEPRKSVEHSKVIQNSSLHSKKSSTYYFGEADLSLKNLLEKKWFFPAITVGLFLIFFLIFNSITQKTDNCWFGGDEWEYQSMAVNYAKGHGLHRFGGMEPFETYKFGFGDPKAVDGFMKNSYQNFYRTPAYPFVLGTIYKIFGVSPAIAKQIQLIWFIIIAVSLPWIGLYFWKRLGFVAGLVSSPIFLATNYKFAERIMTDGFIVFTIYLIVIAYIYFDKKQNLLSTILLGIVITMSWLVKGSFVFVPMVIVAAYLWKWWKSREKKIFKTLIVLVATMVLSLMPWSMYASKQTGQTVLISTQGGTLLLDSHNEFVKGWWIFNVWQNNKDAFYFKDGIDQNAGFKKVLNFYTTFPSKITELTAYRVIAGLSPFLFLILTLVLFLYESYTHIISKYITQSSGWFKFRMILGFAILLWVVFKYPADVFEAQVQYGADGQPVQLNSWLVYDYPYFSEMGAGRIYLIFTLLLIPIIWFKGKQSSLKLPLIYTVVFINFLLLVLMFTATMKDMYWNRFVKPIDFLFITTFFVYLFRFVIDNMEKSGIKTLPQPSQH